MVNEVPPGLCFQLPAGIDWYHVVVQMENGGADKAVLLPIEEDGVRTCITYVPIHSSTRPGRVIIYAPGYATFVSTLTPELLDRRTPLVVPMRRLPTRQVRGTLRDTEGLPVAGKVLRLDYSLIEVMPFFGYYDGIVPTAHVTLARTDRDGAFTFDLPCLEDDPFLGYNFYLRSRDDESRQKDLALLVSSPPDTLPVLDFSAEVATQKRRLNPLEWGALPSSLSSEGYLDADPLPAVPAADAPLALTWRYPGVIYGRIGAGFPARHGIDGSLADLMAHQGGDSAFYLRFTLRQANDNGSCSASLEVRPDGGFSQAVRAGEYQLEAEFLNRNGHTLLKKVVLQENLSIREHDSIALDIK
jgi:hypothetical protein